ncbi:AAA family ATPase [Aeromicrobium sp.]|uniref:AAA family ATPase n=1 Tax=Aeromicrobium sp. TaxID=1871063 RepID=UPI004033FA20
MSDDQPKPVVLPVPLSMVLRNFSLYRRNRVVEVKFDSSVLCLAGANGLGKSTFLAALNYAITGTVAKPDVNFLGASKFYEDISGYASKYFSGRIAPQDHDLAEVEMELSVGGTTFHFVRGMFSPTGLRALRIVRADDTVEDYSANDVSDAERHGRYVKELLDATGLKSFPQLVFLQWFVLTFDEQRHLLFWSDRIIEQALFLAFGYSPESAERAESLQRAYDSNESKARNLQWQATGVRRRLEALEDALGTESETSEFDVQDEHQRLLDALDAAGTEHSQLLASVREAQAKLDEAGIREASARKDYETAFQHRIAGASTAQLHPAVSMALAGEGCAICGSDDAGVATEVRACLDGEMCPLCSSDLTSPGDGGELEASQKLVALGAASVDAANEVGALREHLARQVRALDGADSQIRVARTALEGFRSSNTRALLSGTSDHSVVDDARAGLRREIADLLQQKDEALGKRNEAMENLDTLRKELGRRFVELESEFVPLLQELAYEFLGIPLQVDLERRGHHLGLSLTFQGSGRSSPDALSESQRFFMDIALRMALARKLSTETAPATLYIDTPEGSLDIAYEGRAGKMFGLFAGSEDRIVMTANINTSRLLLELAEQCGAEKMRLVRMTEWSDLTSVQQDAQGQFEEAYADIETRLAGA